MKPGMIRPIGLCLFESGQRLLVAEYYAPSTGIFYRPLGGAIQYGEYSRDCIAREIREETGAEISDVTYLGALESIFAYEGELGHEIVLVYKARFADPRFYELDSFLCRDDGGEFPAVWKPLDELQDGPVPLYPDGILNLMREQTDRLSLP
jgi:8-oxo-dGTP pyrophosphatase MutT (NUDIX family)